jgi:hypothetical protein
LEDLRSASPVYTKTKTNIENIVSTHSWIEQCNQHPSEMN